MKKRKAGALRGSPRKPQPKRRTPSKRKGWVGVLIGGEEILAKKKAGFGVLVQATPEAVDA
eukprot:10402553-Alexandrium_andersonii.AAC.1